MQKRLILPIIIILFISCLILFIKFALPLFFPAKINSALLSSDQQQVRDLMGEPSQFVVTYLPRGGEGNPQLVRSEVWMYPSQGKQISFLAGKLASSENIDAQNIETTKLKPEDFEFDQNYTDVGKILGKDNVNEFYDIPGFEDDPNIKIYASEEALFVIENDHLTYFQTLAEGKEPLLDEQEDAAVVEEIVQEPKNEKTYISSDFGFRITYPQEWYLDYGVLTNYDTNYLSEGKKLPDKTIKCDFNNYDSDQISIQDKNVILEDPIKITKGKAKEVVKSDGPGLGDGVIFLFEQESHDPMSLLCFSHSTSLEDQLIEVLKSFEFVN